MMNLTSTTSTTQDVVVLLYSIITQYSLSKFSTSQKSQAIDFRRYQFLQFKLQSNKFFKTVVAKIKSWSSAGSYKKPNSFFNQKKVYVVVETLFIIDFYGHIIIINDLSSSIFLLFIIDNITFMQLLVYIPLLFFNINLFIYYYYHII